MNSKSSAKRKSSGKRRLKDLPHKRTSEVKGGSIISDGATQDLRSIVEKVEKNRR